MGINGTRLKEEMKGTTRIFGRKEEIQVAFSGNQARVDGDVVVLPDIEGADIDSRQASVMRGFVDHHSGVSKYSDTHLIQAIGGKSEQISTILQSIEDPRIDKQRVSDYVGSRQHISDAVDAMCDSFLKSQEQVDVTSEDVDWRSYVPMAIATLGRKDTGLTADFDKVKEKLPEAAVDMFERHADEVAACDTTLKSLKLAVKLAKEMDLDIPPEVKKIAGDDEDADGGEGGDGENEGEDGKVKKWANPTTDTDPSMIAPDMAAAINFDPDLTTKVTGYKEFYEQDVHIPINIAVKQGKAAYEKSDVGRRITRLGISDYDYEDAHVRMLEGNPHEEGRVAANRLLEQSLGIAGVTRIRLESMLFAKMDRTWTGAQQDGRLDQKRLASAARAAPNVFKHRAAVNEVDAAVHVLVDLSGSMGGAKEKMAAQCALLISECLNKLKVPFAVWGFNTLYELKIENASQIPPDMRTSIDPLVVKRMIGNTIASQHKSSDQKRLKPTSIYHFKDFNDSYVDTRSAIALISKGAGGDNHDAAALYHSYRNIRDRSEKKKVLLVLSDGQPCCNGIPAGSQLKKMVARVEADRSVKTLAIGICSEAPERFYTNASVVHDLHDLPNKALIELGKMIK